MEELLVQVSPSRGSGGLLVLWADCGPLGKEGSENNAQRQKLLGPDTL